MLSQYWSISLSRTGRPSLMSSCTGRLSTTEKLKPPFSIVSRSWLSRSRGQTSPDGMSWRALTMPSTPGTWRRCFRTTGSSAPNQRKLRYMEADTCTHNITLSSDFLVGCRPFYREAAHPLRSIRNADCPVQPKVFRRRADDDTERRIFGHPTIGVRIPIPQRGGMEPELHGSCLPGREGNAAESPEVQPRSGDARLRVLHVKLNHFVAGTLPDVGNVHANTDFTIRGKRVAADAKAVIGKRRVAESMAEREKRRAVEVPVRSTCHRVVLEWRQVIDTVVEIGRA